MNEGLNDLITALLEKNGGGELSLLLALEARHITVPQKLDQVKSV